MMKDHFSRLGEWLSRRRKHWINDIDARFNETEGEIDGAQINITARAQIPYDKIVEACSPAAKLVLRLLEKAKDCQLHMGTLGKHLKEQGFVKKRGRRGQLSLAAEELTHFGCVVRVGANYLRLASAKPPEPQQPEKASGVSFVNAVEPKIDLIEENSVSVKAAVSESAAVPRASSDDNCTGSHPHGSVKDLLFAALSLPEDTKSIEVSRTGEMEALATQLQGLKLKASPGGIDRFHRFGAFSKQTASELSFEWQKSGAQKGTKRSVPTTVAKYYLERYDIELQYPDMPCVQIEHHFWSRPTYLPIELCSILPGAAGARAKKSKRKKAKSKRKTAPKSKLMCKLWECELMDCYTGLQVPKQVET